MNRLIKTMFENRGYSASFLRDINVPDYDNLKDIDTLVVRLKELHDQHIPITIYPDFDMDGISAGTLGFAGLAELGFNVNLFVPDASIGYGVHPVQIDKLLKQFPDTKVILTCDTGIGAGVAADYCKSLGLNFFVTDHHIQSGVINADVIVDPMRSDETYSHPSICGAFVLYQVLQRYADLYCNYFTQDQIRRLRVFAGIGTVSDTMPVLYENRQILKDSVNICRLVYGDGTTSSVMTIPGCDTYRKAFWGLYYFMNVCESYGVLHDSNQIDEDFFGFYMAPVFNAAKRMGGDMMKAFGVFFANDALQCAEYLYNLNIERKELVTRELDNILNSSQPFAPYIYITNARAGILGLLAMKLMEKSGLPTFVFNDEGAGTSGMRYHGSGRSPEWYSCISNLRNMIPCYYSCLASLNVDIYMAGHELAFGCGCRDDGALTKLFEFLDKDVHDVYSGLDVQEEVPDFTISTDWTKDTGIDIELFDDYLNEIDLYRPFGKGFPSPCAKFMFSNRDVVAWKQIGKAKEHLKISFANGFDVLCWNQGYLISQKDSFDNHVVYGHLGRSEYQGVVSINFTGRFVEE